MWVLRANNVNLEPPVTPVPLIPGHAVSVGRGSPEGSAERWWRLRHHSVSRHHAEVAFVDGRWCVRDNGSSNGTRVNGVALSDEGPAGDAGVIRPGDVIHFGDVEVVVDDVPALRPSAGVAAADAGDAGVDHAVVSDRVEIGPRFVFIDPARSPSTQGPTYPELARPRILPRLGQAWEVLGHALPEARWPSFELSAIAADRAVYRYGSDPVVLALVAPRAAGDTVRVVLRRGVHAAGQHSVDIDGRGVGRLALDALASGEYVAELRMPEAEPDGPVPTASFRVGDFELASLAIELVSVTREGDLVRARLSLTSFGAPVSGAVRVQLTSDGRRISVHETDAEGGVVEAELELGGDDAAEIEVAIVDDPTRTARVPLPGTSADDREAVTLSALGPTFVAGRLPVAGASANRRLFVTGGPGTDAPIHLRAVTAPATFEVVTACAAIAISALDPESGATTHEVWDDVAAGTGLTWPHATARPFAAFAVAALVRGDRGALVAWEGRALVLAPEPAVQLEVPSKVAPGAPCALAVHAPWAGPRAAAWVLVRDRRIVADEALADRRAATLADAARAWVEEREVEVRPVARQAHDDEPPRRRRLVSDDPLPSDWRDVREGAEVARSVRLALQADAQLVLFADAVPLVEGRARVALAPRDDERDYAIEVAVIDGAELVAATAALRVEAAAAVVLELPQLMNEDDVAWGQARVRAATAAVRLQIVRGDETVVAVQLAAGTHTIAFRAAPGEHRADLLDDAGATVATALGEVQRLGHPERVVRIPVVLGPFGRFACADDPTCLHAELVGAPIEAFRAFFDATAAYPHGCAEQRAAKLVAWGGLLALARDEAERARARAVLSDGIEAIHGMMSGGRLAAWPGGRHDRNIATRAGHHLLSVLALDAFAGDAALARSRAAIQSILSRELLDVSTPARTGADAWRHYRLGAPLGPLLATARGLLGDAGTASPALDRRVEARADAAFAAAVLLREGDAKDRARALEVAHTLAGAIGPSNRLHSTWDSGAFAALAGALARAGDGLDTEVMADGEAVPLGSGVDGRRAREVRAGALGAGLVAVRWRSDDLAQLATTTAFAARVTGPRGAGRAIYLGEGVRLAVESARYEMGDVLQLELPPALVALHGGARYQRLELDLLGRAALELSLVATAPTQEPGEPARAQTGLVLLRNMYDEARVGRVALSITVAQ